MSEPTIDRGSGAKVTIGLTNAVWLPQARLRITAIKREEYRWPRVKPITNGKHTYTHSGLELVKVETDAGITGLGLGARGRIGGAVVSHLAAKLVGDDPIDVERLWHKMWVPKLIGRRGLTTRAISAIDIALWDIRAKVAGLPLYKMLGGYRDRVPAYVAGGYYEDGKGLKELAAEMAGYVENGARAVKMKVGAISIAEDVQRVRVVRETIGPEIKLMVDANCAYRAFEAIQLAKRIEEFEPYWFEEPVAPDDYEGHRRVADATTIPVATGENEYTRYGFRDVIKHQAAAILQPDATHVGGVTEFMKIAALAQAYDLPVAPHGAQDLHVHLVAAIQNGLIVEFYPEAVHPMWSKMYEHPLRLNDDGTVSPRDVPGIGLEPVYSVLEPYRIS